MRASIHGATRVVLAVALVISTLLLYAGGQVLDEDNFAGLISSSVADAEVRTLLANAAIDVVLDASNADAQLAEALPEDLALIATPAIELTKPTVADAGAALLGVDGVGASLETAARSVHRQAIGSITAPNEERVVISSLPVLVVVADQIGGDAAARAVVGLDLPESATSIDLGSNQSALWLSVSGVAATGALFALLAALAMATYFFTAPRGTRLAALRRLGRTYIRCGLFVMVLAWVLILAVGIAVGLLLAPDEPLTFSTITIGGSSNADGAFDLASVVLAPLVSASRRLVVTGAIMIAGGHLLGGSEVAAGIRTTLRTRRFRPAYEALRSAMPSHIRRMRSMVWVGLIVTFLGWPSLTLRVALTLAIFGGLLLLGLHLVAGRGSRWTRVREQLEIAPVHGHDDTERSARADRLRRQIGVVTLAVAVVWPSYSVRAFMWLVLIVAIAVALTYRYELAQVPDDVADAAIPDTTSWSFKKKLAAGAVAAAAALALFGSGDTATAANVSTLSTGTPDTCNGFGALCDRTLDDVAFAGTHNSMSSSELGWELANHEGAIPSQLEGGIRALLIDVQKWDAAENLDSFSSDPAALAIAREALAVADAPEDGLWMCHKLCQLGGTPFTEFLATLRAFMISNPNEVVVVVIQDEAATSEIKAAIERSGVADMAFAHEDGQPWPTLGELIAADERVVFMAENDGDETGWYQRAFEGNVVETDYSYAVVEDFECAANRGGEQGSFFMINHWVETGLPVPAEADQVNSREVLLERVAECERVRDRSAGIIAVNFWERGDLLQVVNELNGVG